jgi:2-C-methyl-D-erythritol 4-phosphate cytidylyltransferase
VRYHVIIVAGGSGLRMQAAVPKQFLLLQGLPVLMHTINRFHQTLPSAQLIVVLPEDQISFWKQLLVEHHFSVPHQVVAGGETRFHSVKNGLAHLDAGIVGVHDGVRPLVSEQTILRCFSVAEKTGAVVPVMPVNDSTRIVLADGSNQALERSALRSIQTPQCFEVEKLKRAFEQEYRNDFTDDASVMEAAGFRIELVDGNEENIKITRPSDLILAENFLNSPA